MKVMFINPNSVQEVDKYLPKILAEAIIRKVYREMNAGPAAGGVCDNGH